jgi:predicted nucleic acid-binding protein|tara:strand:+ start:1555 stop:1971 length:417 start_codon:yes stop_codon:yes gene_type:complete
MAEKYYLDTSIWIDLFEDRNEPNMPKGRWVQELVTKIIETNSKILYSDINIIELGVVGYSPQDVDNLLKKFKPILIFVESTEKELGKAKDLSLKRNVPKGDALHALIARDNKATLVTLDRHFKQLTDIIKSKKPQDII